MRLELLRGRARSSSGKSQCVSFALAAILLLFSTEHAASQQAMGTEARVKEALHEKSQVAAATSVIAPIGKIAITEIESERSDAVTARPVMSVSNVITGMAGTYIDPQAGETAESLVARALASNGDLIASRRNIERARSRLLQARLRLNPTVSFEQATGRLTGSAGDSMTQVEFLYPLELGGKRTRRIQLAEGDIAAAEAEIANRERLLANDVMITYADALAALRELEIMENSTTIDVATTRLTAARVSEGDAAPLELRLLGVEVQRQQARRTLAEGRLQSAMVRLKSLIGLQLDAALRFDSKLGGNYRSIGIAPMSLMTKSTPLPASLEQATSVALEARPDVLLARVNEQLAVARGRLLAAQAAPDASVFTRYTSTRTVTNLPSPFAPFPDGSKTLSLGVAVALPVFNRNQGLRAEAATAVTQAREQREYLEQIVRAEVTGAYARYLAARAALQIYDTGVIERSNENINTIRVAYQEGAYRLTDLLAEQRRLADSNREYTETLAENYRAQAALLSAMGKNVARK